jgi:hypothetical protein
MTKRISESGACDVWTCQALVAGKIYRIGIHQKKGSGANDVLEAFVAEGDSPFTAPFASSSTQTFTTPASGFRLGATNGSALDIIMDDVRLDRGTMP